MGKRKERQKKGYLGLRSFGRGNVKNRRGSGNRGGRGAAGRDKHKYSWVTKNDPDYFGKHGFVRPVGKKIVPLTQLYEIEQMVIENRIEKKDNLYQFDFNGKILSTGKISVPVFVRAISWSRNCEEKIKKAGGKIVKFE